LKESKFKNQKQHIIYVLLKGSFNNDNEGGKLNLEALYKEVQNILTNLLNSDNSIITVLLADPTGELIHFATRNPEVDEMKLRMAAATIAATFGGARVLGEDFQVYSPNFLIYEFEGGNLVITKCYKDTTLAVLADNNGQLGALRALARKYSNTLNPILEKLYIEIEKEIKSGKISNI